MTIKLEIKLFNIPCYICALFAVNTCIVLIPTKWDATDVDTITTRTAITGTTIAAGAIDGAIAIYTTTIGGTVMGIGHTATEDGGNSLSLNLIFNEYANRIMHNVLWVRNM